jgi:transposase
MSDHFDITHERKLESSADDGRGERPTGVRRIELITGAERRRRWSEDDKVRIVVASFAPGANVSEVARRNGLSPQQLFAWRREARELLGDVRDADVASPAAAPLPPTKAGRARSPATGSRRLGDDAPSFVPLVIASAASPSPPGSPPPPASSGTIEIAIGDAVVRIVGQVEAAVLATVLRAVRRAS